jgi:predicted transglutaminase-like cysteine proteinase
MPRSNNGVPVLRTAFCTVLAALSFLPMIAAAPARAGEHWASYAAVGETTRTPYGWADLCGRQPQECNVYVLDPVDLRLTDQTYAILDQVNRRVNAEIVPVSNYDHWGTVLDHWDYPTDGKGDCKIYALWKRKLLMDLGFPRQALLMTIVRDLEGNGHTILTVKTDHGDFVLDNLTSVIRPWDATGYTFVKRQSQSDPNVWVSVGPDRESRLAGMGSDGSGVN